MMKRKPQMGKNSPDLASNKSISENNWSTYQLTKPSKLSSDDVVKHPKLLLATNFTSSYFSSVVHPNFAS